jgi:ribose transport system permease protein
VFAVGDNPRAAELAGVQVEHVRLGVFVISALAAVTAGVMPAGFGGVSIDVGLGLELQAIAACVVGGVQLMGGRGTLVGAVAGALTLTALFALLTLLGLPQPSQGDGARNHLDRRGRVRRLAPAPRRIAGAALRTVNRRTSAMS